MVSNNFTVSGTKFRWDRSWTHYRVVAVLSENKSENGWPEVSEDQKKSYRKSQKSGWKSHIIELGSPISTIDNLFGIIDTGKIRIYPPFSLNKKEANGHVFDDILLPVGVESVSRHVEIPDYAIKGLNTELSFNDSKPRYGLRVDIQDEIQIDEPLEFFFKIIRQYTKQWWVGGYHNPFDTGLRMSIEIEDKYMLREPLLNRGAGTVNSPWYGASSTQKLIGFENPVDQAVWENVRNCMRSGYGIEDAIQYFLSAVGRFMSYDDRQCIMDLALMIEVAENKFRVLSGRKPMSKNKDLLRDPLVATSKEIKTLRMLITDRDNVAHGRKPYHLSKDFRNIIGYLEVSAEFINRYLNLCSELSWEKTVKLSL